MNLDKFTGSGSTPSRRAFWDNVADAVLSSQKLGGRNASVDEHEGQGTVINFPDQTPSQASGCASTIDVCVSGVDVCTDCISPDSDSYTVSEVCVNGGFTLNNDDAPDYYGPGNCVWFCGFGDGCDPAVCHTDNCDDPIPPVETGVQIVVGRFSGTWYILIWSILNGYHGDCATLLFYGTAASFDSAISNTSSCTPTGCDIALSNTLQDFWFGDGTSGSGDRSWTGIASDGIIEATACDPCERNLCECQQVTVTVNVVGTYRYEPCDFPPYQMEVSGSSELFSGTACSFSSSGTLTLPGFGDCVDLPGLTHQCYSDLLLDYTFTQDNSQNWTITCTASMACGPCGEFDFAMSTSGTGNDFPEVDLTSCGGDMVGLFFSIHYP